jgi:hypothetical protein
MTLLKEAQTPTILSEFLHFDQAIARFQTTRPLLEQHLVTLEIQPHELEGDLYISLAQLHLLDEFYKRLRVGWVLSLLQGLDREFQGV